eukprot:m.114242 g.114242  ORF g.114242 m.114242 type:complete len:505 (+) comp16022_c5_seq1:303-1817(+)
MAARLLIHRTLHAHTHAAHLPTTTTLATLSRRWMALLKADAERLHADLRSVQQQTGAFSFIPDDLPVHSSGCTAEQDDSRSAFMRAQQTAPVSSQHIVVEQAGLASAFAAAADSADANDPQHARHLLQDYTVAVKDVIDVKGMPTTLGLQAADPAATIAKKDAEIVARLRTQGAIIVAKTNVPAGGMDVQSFNSLHGISRNPWDLSRTPAGSSGGSAVAVATRAVRLAIGSDFRGSLRLPAAFCGVYSLRSTPGRIPPNGHNPVVLEGPAAESTVVVGPMANDLDTIERCFQACAKDYMHVRTPTSLSVYITPQFADIPTDDRIVHFFANELPQRLSKLGVHVKVGPGPNLNHKEIGNACNTFAKALLSKTPPPAADMEAAVEARRRARQAITDHLDMQHKDHACWIHPVASVLPYKHNPERNPIPLLLNGKEATIPYWPANLGYVTPITVTGHPVVTFPFGLVDGLPIGGQIVGHINGDEQLLSECRYLEYVWPRMPRPPICV